MLPLLLLPLFVAPRESASPPPCTPPAGPVVLHFQDAPFYDAIDALSHLTCKKFIVTMAARGPRTVTFSSAAPMTMDAAAAALTHALEESGRELKHIDGPYWYVVDKDRILLVDTK